MTVNEVLMKPGRWSLRFTDDTPKSVLDRLNWQVTPTAGFGHVCIFPTRINPKLYSTAQLLSLARYTGVLREWADDRTIAGPGPAFWLGDENAAGDLLETAVGYSASTLSTWVGGLRPSSLNAGSVAGIGSHTGSYQWVTRRAALDAVCAAIGAEWRVTPALALDANTAANLWPDTDVVITRRAESRDIAITGLRTTGITAGVDLVDYTTKVRTSSKNGVGTASAATSFLDINGNAVKLIRYVETPEVEDANAAATALLSSSLSARKNVRLTSDVYDIRRDLEPGQWVYVYDPEIGLVDATYKITYAGQHITPARLRVHGITWPIREGMGVAFRDGNGNWTDLTDWIEWESGDVALDVGGYARTVLGSVGASGTPQLASPADDGRWTAFTPQVLQNGSPVSSTVNSARYRRHGSTIHWEVDLSITASGSAGTIAWQVPIDFADSSTGCKGQGQVYDASTTTRHVGVLERSGAGYVHIVRDQTLNAVGSTFALASGDIIRASGTYEASIT